MAKVDNSASIGLRISQEDREQLEAIAEEKGWSLSLLVREIIKEHLKKGGNLFNNVKDC